MKKSTRLLKLLMALMLCLSIKTGYSQCSASFGYNNISGSVTFTSTSVLSNSTSTTYYWTLGNGTATYTVYNNPGTMGTYTANGTYTVTLFIMSTVPTCSSSATQTISVTGVVPTGTACNINANFSASQNGTLPGSLQFYNFTTGMAPGVTYSWNFGDGGTSTSNVPSHTYASNGNYTVTLIADNNYSVACVSTKTAVVNVNSICNLSASYNYSVGANGLVTFSSTSTGYTTGANYYWNYGNGASSSGTNQVTSSVTYSANGLYVVQLMVSTNSPSCSSVYSQTINVTGIVTPTCNINANFSLSQAGNGVVNFNNTSTGTASTTTYSWNFGDAGISTSTSPSHTYAGNGTYTVTLTADNNFTPSCTSTKTMVIVVSSYCNLSAGFTYTQDGNGNVSFNSTSTGTVVQTNYTWQFGDNGYWYYSFNPTHHYLAGGTYTVQMAVNNSSVNPGCSDTTVQVITVTNTCIPNANFSMTPSGTPHYWYAVPASSVGVSNAVWYWGDGATSSGLYSSHTYSAAGNYAICLSVTVSCGASATSCYTYYISRSANDNSVIHLDVVNADQLTTGIKSSSAKDIAYTVSPNPNNGNFKLNINGLNASKAKINVYSLVGTLVYESESDVSNGAVVKDINLETVSGGVYFIKINADNKEFTKKLIINK